MRESSINVVVTGMAWMGSGIGSIESALERLFREAEHELMLTVYAISRGADIVLEWMEEALARGVQVRLIINRLYDQPQEEVLRLRRLAELYPYFYLYDFLAEDKVDLHAKVIIADRNLAVVGSSNLSRRGFLTNHELAVLLHGPPASSTASALDRLISSRYVTRVLR